MTCASIDWRRLGAGCTGDAIAKRALRVIYLSPGSIRHIVNMLMLDRSQHELELSLYCFIASGSGWRTVKASHFLFLPLLLSDSL